jgi:hypothetical protein
MTARRSIRLVVAAACLASSFACPALADDDPYIPGAHIPSVVWKLPNGEIVLANTWRYFADPIARPAPDGPPLRCSLESVQRAVVLEAHDLLAGRIAVTGMNPPTEVIYDAKEKVRVCKTQVGNENVAISIVFMVKHGRQAPQQVVRFLNRPNDYKLKK